MNSEQSKLGVEVAKNVLVCGGAGYIGSHVVKQLLIQGCDVVVLDNLETGHAEAVPSSVKFVEADIDDSRVVRQLLEDEDFDCVMHFAASSLVSESVRNPIQYFKNNVAKSISLIQTSIDAGVNGFVFSSTAAVYGDPKHLPLTETSECKPINPYGLSKRMVEQILQEANKANGFNSVTFRYFNAAGATMDASIGEAHEPETHLIPNVIAALNPGSQPMKIFGGDYDTADGTCVRDYLHVEDIASAHVRAMDFIALNPGAHIFNLGTGAGYTVQQIVESVERVSGERVPFEVMERRAGDPPILLASSELATRTLGWVPQHSEIDNIVSSALRWHQNPRFGVQG